MINQVIDIVKQAGELCLLKEFDIENKGNNSNYVTSIDVAVEGFLREKLPALILNSVMVGEEGENLLKEAKYIWVVDPIDGTANFIRRYNLSAISVGLLEDGVPVLGVVYNPFTKDIYYANKGCGAYLNGKRITVSNRDFNHSILCTAYSLYDKKYAPPCFRVLERVYYEIDDQRRLGTAALELASVAAGCSELYFEIRLNCWDCVGAFAILNEAGAFWATDGGGQKIFFDRPFSVVVGNTKENFERLLDIVNDEIKKFEQL